VNDGAAEAVDPVAVNGVPAARTGGETASTGGVRERAVKRRRIGV
jgi:uncharacterized Zn-binding protein involved in type VI secretion